jgi:hypothetical protein
MQFYRTLEAVLNVAANGHFTLTSRKVLGNVIERVDFLLGGGALTKAMITNHVVRLNGKTTFGPISATNLDLENRYLTIVNDATRFSIDFTELVARSVQGQMMGAIDTAASGVTEFVIEGDITGATTPTMVAACLMRSPSSLSPERGFDPRTRALIRGLIPSTVTETAAGEFQHDINYGSKANSLIKRLFIHSTILTAFRARRDSLDIYGDAGAITAAQAEYITELNGRLWQTNMYVLDFLAEGNQPDALPTRVVTPQGTREANFEWLFTASGAGVHSVFADVYSLLDDL